VTLAETPGDLPEFDAPGISEVSIDGRTLRITADSAGGVAQAVLRALDRTGHRVVDLDVRRATLEEVFVEITRLGDDSSAADASTADAEARRQRTHD
jgi:ABC-2 type transport system ATP-binding protein